MDNPFRFCPACGADGLRFEADRRFTCARCGFEYFHNVATAAGAVIEAAGKILFLVRVQEPALGRLALPGGFVDPGSGRKRRCGGNAWKKSAGRPTS